MAKKKRITRKKLLKEPDKIITASGKIIQFVMKHRAPVTWAMSGFLAIILIFLGINYFRNIAEDRAFAMLDDAMATYNSRIEEKGPLVAFLEVENEFQQILDKYSGRRGGKFARFIYANICYNAGNFEKAIELYQLAFKDFKDIQPYKNLILKSLGLAYENKEDYDAAVRYFEQVASGTDTLMRDDALFALGRIYMAMGQVQQSIETYNVLIEEYPNHMYIEIAKDKVGSKT